MGEETCTVFFLNVIILVPGVLISFGVKRRIVPMVFKCTLSPVVLVVLVIQFHSAVPFRLFVITGNYVRDLLQEACFPYVMGGSEN